MDRTATFNGRRSGARSREGGDRGLVPLHLYGIRRRTVNIVTVACGAFTVFTLLPIWWIFVSSTKTAPNVDSTFGFWFARPFVLFSNLKDVFTDKEGGSFSRWVMNTAIYAGSGAFGATVLSAMAGYGFARFQLPRQEGPLPFRDDCPAHSDHSICRPAVHHLRQSPSG